MEKALLKLVKGTFLHRGQTFTIRSAQWRDVELLRVWKNKHRQFFFTKDEIKSEDQEKWFRTYLEDDSISMYMCEFDGSCLACVGMKEIGNMRLELFNLICGEPKVLGLGLMRHFYQSLEEMLKTCGYAGIELSVLKDNPAVTWYKKQGFVQMGEASDFFRMEKELC